jgi:hypothetical protein
MVYEKQYAYLELKCASENCLIIYIYIYIYIYTVCGKLASFFFRPLSSKKEVTLPHSVYMVFILLLLPLFYIYIYVYTSMF